MRLILAALLIGILSSTSAIAEEPMLDPPFLGKNSDSGKINSGFGPRNPGASGSKFHPGIDYNLDYGGGDYGALVHVFVEGTIDSIIVKGAAQAPGHSVTIVRTGNPSDTVQLLHLFYDPSPNGTTKFVVDAYSVDSSEKYKVVLAKISAEKTNSKTKKTVKKSCPYIIFLDSTGKTLVHAYTEIYCVGFSASYGSISLKNATSKVVKSKFRWIAPMGRSGAAKGDGGHLHVQVPRGPGYKNKMNPLVLIKHAIESGPYSTELCGGESKTCTDTSNPELTLKISDNHLLVRVRYSPSLDFNRISIELPKEFGGGLANWKQVTTWDLGGRRGEDSENPEGADINDINDIIPKDKGKCLNPGISYTTGKICVEPWSVINVDDGSPDEYKELYFYQPIDLTNVCSGKYKVKINVEGLTDADPPVEKTILVQGKPNCPVRLYVTDQIPGWSEMPASIDISDFKATPKYLFASVGTIGNTCNSGERGLPLFSVEVDSTAQFYGELNVIGVPYYSSGPFINRRPCSSFFAKSIDKDGNGKVWINATGRAWQTNGFSTKDWEYQVRYYSGDPAQNYSDANCVVGVVPNAGFFGTGQSIQCHLKCDEAVLGKLPNCQN